MNFIKSYKAQYNEGDWVYCERIKQRLIVIEVEGDYLYRVSTIEDLNKGLKGSGFLEESSLSNLSIEKDIGLLIDLALDTKDKNWFYELTRKLP